VITKNEIAIQIALGTVSTPQQIAQLVRHTTDIDALEWAIKYKNTKVRAAAIKNDALPVGLLLYSCTFETSKTARKVLEDIIYKRQGEVERVLHIIRHYPQLSMDLNNESTP